MDGTNKWTEIGMIHEVAIVGDHERVSVDTNLKESKKNEQMNNEKH